MAPRPNWKGYLTRSSSIAPLGPTFGPVHLVLCNFGKLGTAYVETEPVTTEPDVVHDILTGEYDVPLDVVAFSVSEGWPCDASEDVARLVLEKARAEHVTLSEGARRFVSKHLDEEVEWST